MHRRTFILSALAALAPGRALTAPQRYRVVPGGARIAYIFDLQGAQITGTAPIKTADLNIDPGNLTASTADVRADLTRARTGLIFATEALKSASVLDVARHPEARFVSTAVRLGPGGRISSGAALEGRLTLRGVTQNIRFDAGLFRPPGSAPDDLSALQVRLRGAVRRADFDATGYAGLVADRVGIDITADIRAD
ncbi:MAG: YceI family protein [Pseudomonadota bacterium]